MISRLPSRKWNLISLVDDNVTSILIHSALIPVVYQEKEIILVQKCSQPGMTWKNLKEVTRSGKGVLGKETSGSAVTIRVVA